LMRRMTSRWRSSSQIRNAVLGVGYL
jgi:hypothetical protein